MVGRGFCRSSLEAMNDAAQIPFSAAQSRVLSSPLGLARRGARGAAPAGPRLVARGRSAETPPLCMVVVLRPVLFWFFLLILEIWAWLENYNQKLLLPACGCQLLQDGCGFAAGTCSLKPNLTVAKVQAGPHWK